MSEFYKQDIESVLKGMDAQATGLSSEEASQRIIRYGPNELRSRKKKSIFIKFIRQLENLTVLILIAAAVISGILGETTDMFIILTVVLINAILGVLQEEKAEKSLEALKKLSQPYAAVIRDKKQASIKSSQIVPGDIVLLEAGSIVPADMRLTVSSSLRIDESALTGESSPAEKDSAFVTYDTLMVGDRQNMAHSGCSVLYGRAAGIATATGMDTEVGRIADMISSDVTDKTPLEKKLTVLARYISIGVVVIALIIFFTGLFGGHDPFDMFLTAVAIAVAAIPEGLPAIVTIVLAIGVQKMPRRNAIVRRLPAVETLGSTQIICSDKTGTLTQNKMRVEEIFINGIHFKDENDIRKDSSEFDLFNKIMMLCNDADHSGSNFAGDPTETALLEFGIRFGYNKALLSESLPRMGEIPFDSGRKLMSTFHMIEGKKVSFTKGAPDILLQKCSRILINDEISEITDEHIKYVHMANNDMSERALRVLGASYKESWESPEDEMIFLGLAGMIDPPREESFQAVQTCLSAGILPIMITGDHAKTAYAIAYKLGIAADESQVLSGEQIEKLTDDELADMLERIRVYARVSPEHKVRIVRAWKSKDKIVAMTGDGVNDAPALKAAHIGVGMGISGTEVSKSVSDIVLTDDNFATIVAAVEEGRKIFSNIKKAVQFLLSANIGEVLTLFIATLLNKVVLLPIHILWINLVTDTLPAIALGMEKSEKDIMRKPPEANSSFFKGSFTRIILYQGFIEGLIVLSVYLFAGSYFSSNVIAMTMAFVTLGLIQLFHAFNVRSEKSLFRIGFFTNKYLNIAFLISSVLQLSVVIFPFLNKIFRVVSLDLLQWTVCIIASFSIIIIVEVVKLIISLLNKGSKHES